MRWKKVTAWGVLFLCLSFTVACRKVALHQGLDEVEVDEILVLLHDNGIEANKELEENNQNQAASWRVTVDDTLAPQARQILIAHNLPRKKELGLSGVYKEKGLIPTPDEQKARYLLALKGEIINSLHKIPGVVDVDVVLNVPNQDEFNSADTIQKRPTASVIVRTTGTETVIQTVTEPKLQKFVANTVPNLDPNDVAVIISRTNTSNIHGAANTPIAVSSVGNSVTNQNTPQTDGVVAPQNISVNPEDSGEPASNTDNTESVTVAGVSVNADSAGRLKVYVAVFLVILMALSGFLIFYVLRLNRMKMKVQKGAAMPLPVGQNPQLLGGQGPGDFNALGGGANTGAFDSNFNQGPGGGAF